MAKIMVLMLLAALLAPAFGSEVDDLKIANARLEARIVVVTQQRDNLASQLNHMMLDAQVDAQVSADEEKKKPAPVPAKPH